MIERLSKSTVALVTALVAPALVGCQPGASPPAGRQGPFGLICNYLNPDQTKAPLKLIFLIDPARGRVSVPSLNDNPIGSLRTTENAYFFSFPAQGNVYANDVRVNRFDGQMTREFGKPPFALDPLNVPAGNVLQSWSCVKGDASALF